MGTMLMPTPHLGHGMIMREPKMKRHSHVVFAAFLISLALAGCRKGGPDSAGKNQKIAWYALLVHPYFDEVQKGVAAFEKDTGISVRKRIGQDASQDNENANVEALAAQGYRGFSIYPADAGAANGLYEELADNGLFVVSYGAPTALPTPASFCVATDVKKAAGMAAEALIRFMGGKGNILNVLELVEDPNTVLRREGVEEAVARHDGVRIVQTIAGMTSFEESMGKIQDALSARIREIDGVLCTGYTPTVAATTILSEWHAKPENRRIRFVGIDTDEVVLKAIEAGHIDGTIAQNPYGHGYISCKLLSYLLSGWSPKKGTYFVDTGAILVTQHNLRTFRDEVLAATQSILGELETKYLDPPR